MDVSFTWLVLIPAVITIVCIALIRTRDSEDTILGVVILIVAVLGWNIAVPATSMNTYAEETNDIVVAKDFFGFESGKTYPLALGSQSTYQQGSFDTNAGLFSASFSGDFVGGTTITVAFTQSDTTYTLSLPRDSTPIKINDEAEPNMTVWLQESHTAEGATGTWSDCDWHFRDLAFACIRTYTEEGTTARPGVREAGLGKLVAESFSSAEITMTQTMYDQMIGKIE